MIEHLKIIENYLSQIIINKITDHQEILNIIEDCSDELIN
jgi:hypothetical protein